MRAASVAVLAFAVVAAALLAGGMRPGPSVPGVQAQHPPEREDAPEQVIIRRSPGPRVLAQRDSPPSLDELGYEAVPVPEGMTPQEFIAELQADEDIDFAEPDARVYAAATPNDPYYQSEQHPYLSSINVPEAWDLAVGREEIVVAVLDSGADLAHPDLAPRLWTNPSEIDGNNQDDSGSGCIDDVHGCRFVTVTPENQALCGYQQSDGVPNGNVWDDHGAPGTGEHSHGTMVSGIIGAAGNNGQGIAGVGWNIRLMIVKVLDCGSPTGGQPGGHMWDIAQGIDYARRMGADVINLSLASLPGNENANIQAVRDAIAAAEAQGVIIVAAAGNHGGQSDPSPGYPAAYTEYSNLIAVGGSNWEQGHTWIESSSWGPSLDFAAPGNDIVGTARSDIGLQVPYAKADEGTSLAAPLVSGMFALMKSANARLGHQAYINLARDAAMPAPEAPHGGNWAGSGIIDVGGAVKRVPMQITGWAMHNWVDVEPGTPVEARVGNARCGQVDTFAFGLGARFEINVDPAGVKAGCGAPGKTVTLYVDGVAARETFRWGGPTQHLVHAGQHISSVSPPPGPVIVQQLEAGWNNVAHFESNAFLPGALAYLPSSWEAAFFWDVVERDFLRVLHGAPSYTQEWQAIERWDTYWVHLASRGNAASVNPSPEPGRTIELTPGWNNFVFTGSSEEMSASLKAIEGKYDYVYRFDNASGEWQSYVPGRSRFFNSLGGLLNSRVYWIHMNETASFVME